MELPPIPPNLTPDEAVAFVNAAVEAYRARMVDAVQLMAAARSAEAFTAAERLIVELARETAADITRRVLEAISVDAARRKSALASIRERCQRRGITVRTERDRETKVRTLGGQLITVKTPYVSARPRTKTGVRLDTRGAQGTGVYPVLDQLGIAGRSTPALRLLLARSLCEANSVGCARELLSATGVDIDHKAALRLTYMVSDEALAARAEAVRVAAPARDDGAFAGRRVVATVDGGRVNIRSRVAGRPRKGGRKHFETEWREPKILTIYVLGKDGRRDRSVPPVIDGTLGDADAVFALLLYHLRKLGAHKATDLTLVADGAPWIWNRAEQLRAELGIAADAFHQIVDYFHVVERLGEYARARPKWTDERRRDWLAVQKKRLKDGLIEEIEAVFKVIGGQEKSRATKAYKTELEYWSRNRERLRYGTFRASGLPIGSGAVESAVRRVINLRLKGASISWTEAHAEGVLHLRAYSKSGRWNELERAVLSRPTWQPTARQPRAAT